MNHLIFFAAPKRSIGSAYGSKHKAGPSPNENDFRDWFHELELEDSGIVNPVSAKELFLKSGLSQDDLFFIWYGYKCYFSTTPFRDAADEDQDGQLNEDEFIKACTMIAEKVEKKTARKPASSNQAPDLLLDVQSPQFPDDEPPTLQHNAAPSHSPNKLEVVLRQLHSKVENNLNVSKSDIQ